MIPTGVLYVPFRLKGRQMARIDSSHCRFSLPPVHPGERMAKDFIGYQALTDAALRGVVRDALRRVEKQGLVASHHFYLTFKTHFPGVDIPDFLREQYPDEMTIILQHQFWGLKVKDDHFEVALTFRKLPATLVIPFAALTKFFDPGVQFGLEFKDADSDAKAGGPAHGLPPQAAAEQNQDKTVAETPAAEAPEKPAAPGEVVSLDSFRKK